VSTQKNLSLRERDSTQKSRHFAGADRRADVISLDFIAPLFAQKGQLRLRLHSLRDDFHRHAPAHREPWSPEYQCKSIPNSPEGTLHL